MNDKVLYSCVIGMVLLGIILGFTFGVQYVTINPIESITVDRPLVYECTFTRIAGKFQASEYGVSQRSGMITVFRGDRKFMFSRDRIDYCAGIRPGPLPVPLPKDLG